jgi:hypothetical protein
MLHAAIAAGILFVGSSPCDPQPRAFVGVPAGADCERITWELTLSEPGGSAGTFSLAAVYGMTAVNDPGFAGGGTKAQIQGTWTAGRGRAFDPDAVVYRLTAGGARTLEFARLDDNLLHPIDGGKELMVGNPGWSYTLTRKTPVTSDAHGPDTLRPNARESASPTAAAASGAVASVWEGRTPCQAIARQMAVKVSADCFKLKWRLTFYLDAGSKTSGAYTLETTTYRTVPRTGTWSLETIGKDRRVYRLDPDERGAFLALQQAGERILLLLDPQGRPLPGDILFSYTLNRVK